jgi:hypothetical protein
MTTVKEFLELLEGKRIVSVTPDSNDMNADCTTASFEVVLENGYCFVFS